MSFVFRGARGDIENGFPGFMPARRALRVHAARPSNSNSLTFLVTALASAWCFFDGYNAKDVCDMSTTSSPGPSFKTAFAYRSSSLVPQVSPSTSAEKTQDNSNAAGNSKASDDDLTCSVCLEQVNVGDVLRSLPCLHQEVLDILEEFQMMSSREMVEFDKTEDGEKKIGRMVPLTIEHKKTLHARQKVARGETWSDDPMSHACGLLGEFKIKSNG
ncbi:hypothetical protein KIW84_055782 [Lathyrus oleraceus]|uniref:RING-type E3 ubiquitin transferase n=1 Tax=Pisum sativum TaxID=3888 RepID=A0A9D4WYS1_PEA|nr:hypothetical protein KIW84_055782 [Pisum sativum]